MGSTELALLLRYGIPLAVKLLAGGKDTDETTEAVTNAVTGIAIGENAADILVNASDEDAKGIVDAMFDVITGATAGIGNLVSSIGKLFGN